MKFSKRSLSMMVAIILCAAMTIGGTFAYLTDTTEEVANVMTVGSVHIAQTETFDETTANLLPGVKITKEIFVENTGKSDAYVRTLVSFEMGTMSEADFVKYVKWSYNETDWTQGTPYTEGGKYVVPFTYKTALAPNATTPASLTKVWLDETAGNAQVEQLANAEGKYTVYALSQAVQTEGFDTAEEALAAAFGAAPQKVTTSEELASAISAAQPDEPVTLQLADGTYTISTSMTGKDITFTGTKDAIIDLTADIPATNDAVVTFNGVTVKFPYGNYNGFTHIDSIKYVNCTLEGTQFLYADAEFINCEFNVTGDAYSIWTYSANKATFTGCTFNTSGKAILVYNEATADSFVADIELNNCIFNDDGTLTSVKAAVETGSNANNTATSNKYNLTFTTCTTNGFEANSSTSNLWGNKNSMDTDHLNVIIDGTDVY